MLIATDQSLAYEFRFLFPFFRHSAINARLLIQSLPVLAWYLPHSVVASARM